MNLTTLRKRQDELKREKKRIEYELREVSDKIEYWEAISGNQTKMF